MLKLASKRQLTHAEKGAITHAESGNTSSNVHGQIGVRIDGRQWLVDIATGQATDTGMVAREQCFHRGGEPVVAESLNVQFPAIPAAPGEAGYNWTIVPAAENNLSQYEVLWIRRRSWSNDPKRVIPQWFATVDVKKNTILGVYAVAQMTAEKDPNRKQEIHACHQANGNLLFMHERERTGVYDRSTFVKQWMLVDRNGKLMTVVGKGLDHPTYRNSRMYFTTSTGIANAQGGEVYRFEDGVACMHQCIDQDGNLVCSVMRKSPGGWLEFEIRVLDRNWQTIAVLPLHQLDQSEAGDAWALLSRPFGFWHDGKYRIAYHEPAEEDWSKPIKQRRPQVWVATFEEDEPDGPPDNDTARIDQLVEQVHDLQQLNTKLESRLANLEAFVKSEFERPLVVIRK